MELLWRYFISKSSCELGKGYRSEELTVKKESVHTK